MKFATCVILVLIFLSGMPANAASYVYSTTGSDSAGSIGNTLTPISSPGGGPGLTVTAHSNTGAGSIFAPAAISSSGNGVGVCSSVEFGGGDCFSSERRLDNIGNVDALMFAFDQLVNPAQITLRVLVNIDYDYQYLWGGSSGPDGFTIAQLVGVLGYTSSGNITVSAPGADGLVDITLDVPIQTQRLVFMSSSSSTPNSDGMFIKQIEINFNPSSRENVPEPATYGLIAATLAGLALYRRNVC